jgi:uncharacterized RDD family membrane protein YckC
VGEFMKEASLQFKIGAIALDVAIISNSLVVPVLFFVFKIIFENDFDISERLMLIPLSSNIAVIIVFFFRNITRGQSIGKYLLGLAIKNSDGTTPSIAKILERNFKQNETEIYRVNEPKPIAIAVFITIFVFIFPTSFTIWGFIEMLKLQH